MDVLIILIMGIYFYMNICILSHYTVHFKYNFDSCTSIKPKNEILGNTQYLYKPQVNVFFPKKRRYFKPNDTLQ